MRPNSLPIASPDKVKQTLSSVPGVKAVVQDGNAFKCYADMETELGAVEAAAAGSVTSHEWLSLTASGGNEETAGRELGNTKYVLCAEIGDEQVRVLCVKGRVTRALIKSLLTKAGFKVK